MLVSLIFLIFVDKQWKNRLQLQDDRVKRIQHEANQMELKHKEKENEYRMINLKIKELKRTIQGTYVHKATKDNRTNRKKSARSVTKNMKPTPKEPERVIRPNSSKRGGLAEAIKQEYKIDHRDFETPIEANTVTRGVDFNGGDDDYDEDFDRTMEQTDERDHGRALQDYVLDKFTQENTFRQQKRDKEYYSRVANEELNNRENAVPSKYT